MLPFYRIVGNANDGGVVAIDGGGRLRVSHFFSASQKIVACLQFRKRALSSTSAADATTNHKNVQRVKNALFNLIGLFASGF